MALFEIDLYSHCLQCNHNISVIVPDCPHGTKPADFYASGKRYPVLWLLHGSFGDHSDWLRKSMVELYAEKAGLICVMPSALNTDYINWPNFGTGFMMDDYLTEELMPFVQNWLPASSKREDNFIAGLSMGSVGALHFALDHPDRFAGAAMLSAAPELPDDIHWEMIENPAIEHPLLTRARNRVAAFGGKEAYIKGNLYTRLVDAYESGTDLPKMYFCCGDSDPIVGKGYFRFKELAQKVNLPLTFHELPGYGHEWRFWDKEIENAIAFFGFDTLPPREA